MMALLVMPGVVVITENIMRNCQEKFYHLNCAGIPLKEYVCFYF